MGAQNIEYEKMRSLKTLIEVLGNSYPEVKSVVIFYPDPSCYKPLKSLPQEVTTYSSLQNLNQSSTSIDDLMREILKNDVCIVERFEQFIRVQSIDTLKMLVEQYFSANKTVILSLNSNSLSDPELQEFWHDLFCSKCAKIIEQSLADGQEFLTIAISNTHLVNAESSTLSRIFQQSVREAYDEKKNHTKTYLSEGKIIKQVCRNANPISYRELMVEFQNFQLLAELDVDMYTYPTKFEIVEAGWITKFEREFIEGTSLDKLIITPEGAQRIKSLLFEACIRFANNRLFPNDLRPWNCVVTEKSVHLIDFPKNIKIDADCDKISNLLSLVVCFAWLDSYGKRDYYDLLEEMKLLLCSSNIYFDKDFQLRISEAWLSLECFRDNFLQRTNSLSERFEYIVEGFN